MIADRGRGRTSDITVIEKSKTLTADQRGLESCFSSQVAAWVAALLSVDRQAVALPESG